jgi:hypothetical protein
MNMQIHLRAIMFVIALLSPSLAMPQPAAEQGASKPHHTIVPLPQDGLMKSLARGFEIVSGDPDKAGAPFVILTVAPGKGARMAGRKGPAARLQYGLFERGAEPTAGSVTPISCRAATQVALRQPRDLPLLTEQLSCEA